MNKQHAHLDEHVELIYYIKYTYPNNLTPNKVDDSYTCSGKLALENNMILPVLPTICKMNKQSVLTPCSVNMHSVII